MQNENLHPHNVLSHTRQFKHCRSDKSIDRQTHTHTHTHRRFYAQQKYRNVMCKRVLSLSLFLSLSFFLSFYLSFPFSLFLYICSKFLWPCVSHWNTGFCFLTLNQTTKDRWAEHGEARKHAKFWWTSYFLYFV
jgi:hypothetical protein